jgi:hypothetical protein
MKKIPKQEYTPVTKAEIELNLPVVAIQIGGCWAWVKFNAQS